MKTLKVYLIISCIAEDAVLKGKEKLEKSDAYCVIKGTASASTECPKIKVSNMQRKSSHEPKNLHDLQQEIILYQQY